MRSPRGQAAGPESKKRQHAAAPTRNRGGLGSAQAGDGIAPSVSRLPPPLLPGPDASCLLPSVASLMCGVDGGLSAFTSSKFAGRPRKTRRRRRNERAQLRAVAPLLSVSAGGRRTSCAERVDVCVRECVRARACRPII